MDTRSSRRRNAAITAIVLLLLVAGGVWQLRGRLDPSAAGPRVRVSSVAGVVEAQKGDGSWNPVKTGDALTHDQRIRTGATGSALVQIGDRATVTIAPDTTLSVAEIEKEVSRVDLTDGRITAVVQTNATLRVVTAGSDAVAESSGGEFSVLADGNGRLSVATKKGKVRLSAGSRSVEVAEGRQSVAGAEQPPIEPVEIPPTLFLKLHADKKVQRETESTVQGSTVPGALVSVNGVRVGVSENGSFALPVALKEGENRVRVEVVDATGRVQSGEIPITVDASVGDVKTGVTW